MSHDARRKILEAVADGRMDPSEAAEALSDLDAPVSDTPETHPPIPDASERVVEHCTSIKVGGSFRAIEVIGDDGVKEAIADGPHRVRWEGSVLVIDGSNLFDGTDADDDDDELPSFGEWFRTTTARGAGAHRARMAYRRDHRDIAKPRPLRVRVNPDLPLEARVEAGPLTIRRVRGPVKARVAAGPLVIEGFESPVDLRVAAGKVVASGFVDHGISTIDCDAGKVRLHLESGTDARVNATATLGKVGFGGRAGREHERERVRHRHGRDGDLGDLGERIASVLNDAFSDEHEIVVGRGTATFDVRVSMGSADITFEDEPRP